MTENCCGIAHDDDAHAGDLGVKKREEDDQDLAVRSVGEI